MSKLSQQFQGLPMKDLIGGPLAAACDAQIQLAQAAVNFITTVGMEEDEATKSLKTRTVDFSFTKPVQDEKTGTVTMQKVDLRVPLLAIVNNPALGIKEVDINFTMEVKESTKDSSEKHAEASIDAKAKYGFGLFSATVSVHGSVSSKSSHTRATDNSAKYDVKVVARDDGMPEGLSRVLDILQQCIVPTDSSTTTHLALSGILTAWPINLS